MQIKHRLKMSIMISTVLLLAVTSFSFLGSIDYSAYGKKDSDQSQNNKQNTNCEAGEDNNNSCNNISITRHNGGSGSAGGSSSNSDNDGGNQVQVSKQEANCEAGEDNNNSCNNFDLKEMISDGQNIKTNLNMYLFF
ncbi:hypothetical protein BH23THE1_BH23THE1_18390 [soil metagenome]